MFLFLLFAMCFSQKIEFFDQGCNISFSVENVFHNIEMIEDITTIFSPKLKVNGNPHKYKRNNKIFRSKENTMFGTVSIGIDNNIIDGMFITETGVILEWTNNQFIKSDINISDIVMNDTRRTLEFISFIPNCYQNENLLWSFRMGIVYEHGLYQKLLIKYGNLNGVLENLDYVFAIGRLVFFKQMNIILLISKITVGNKDDPVPLSNVCQNALGSFDQMGKWNFVNNPKKPTGYNMFLGGDCFSGITGVSYIGSICGSTTNYGVSKYHSLTIFHELGHGFGAQHTFPENGKGGGGIMDYSDGIFEGKFQFNPRNKNEICSIIDYNVKNKCPFFRGIKNCGNYILEPGEKCECLKGVTKCPGCVNCKLTKKNTQCSTANFVISRNLVESVSKDLLSDTECCKKGKLSGPKTVCDIYGGCSLGKCINTCSFITGISCGFTPNGCGQRCFYNGICRDNDIFSLPVGTSCIKPDGKRGSCESYSTCS